MDKRERKHYLDKYSHERMQDSELIEHFLSRDLSDEKTKEYRALGGDKMFPSYWDLLLLRLSL